jgi:ribosome modulation factor
VIEGACRHLIKDRMERAGMHWTLAGAQAMLDLRSVWIGGHWEAFEQQRIERATAQTSQGGVAHDGPDVHVTPATASRQQKMN